jgi:hypothetical protein
VSVLAPSLQKSLVRVSGDRFTQRIVLRQGI